MKRLTIHSLAESLAVSVGKVRQYVREGMPHDRTSWPNGHLRFDEVEVAEWLRMRRARFLTARIGMNPKLVRIAGEILKRAS